MHQLSCHVFTMGVAMGNIPRGAAELYKWTNSGGVGIITRAFAMGVVLLVGIYGYRGSSYCYSGECSQC